MLGRIQLHKALTIFIILLICWGNFDLNKIAYQHTMKIKPNDNDNRIEKINDVIFIKSLKDILPSEEYAIFNCKHQRNISIMFYTNFIAYDQPLDYSNYILLKNKKQKIAAIKTNKLPSYLLNDSTVIKIPAPDSTWEN